MSSASIEEYKSGFVLQKQNIQWYFDNYFQHAEDRKKASPLFMEITPNFPETLVITAGFCPLRDEGISYVHTLRQHSIRAEHVHFDDMIHAFMNMESLFPARTKEMYEAMRSFFSSIK
jgi:acetyl esterase/lipase